MYLEPVVGPAPELHLTVLVVEGEPGDVDGAGGLEYPGRDVGAEARAGHHLLISSNYQDKIISENLPRWSDKLSRKIRWH